MKKQPRNVVTLAAILLFALILRFISINQSLWLDEATSAIVARDLSFNQIVNSFSPADFHPPLYYLVLKLWSSVAGTGEVGLRLLSVLLGVGTIYLTYLIGDKILNKKLGLISALFLATSGLHIYYSQELRMYSLATFLVTLTIFMFVKGFRRTDIKINSAEWVLFSLTLLLIGATYYLALLIMPVFWIYAAVEKKSRRWWKKFLLTHAPLVVGFIVWLPIFTKQLTSGIGAESTSPLWWNILGRTTIKSAFLVPTKFMMGRISFDNKAMYAFLTLCVGILFFYLFIRATKTIKKTKLVWLWLFVPIVVAATVGLFIPVFSYFRLIFVLPAFYLILASGVLRIKRKYFWMGVTAIFVVNLLSSGYYLSNKRFHREDWRGMVDYVESAREENSIVLFPANSQMEAYVYYQPNAKISGPSGLNDSFGQIWLIRYAQPIFDVDDNVRKSIEDLGYEKISEHNYHEVVVWNYENRN